MLAGAVVVDRAERGPGSRERARRGLVARCVRAAQQVRFRAPDLVQDAADAVDVKRLAAVRRLAYEAADSGLLSSDLAAGIRRVKGVKKLGVKIGNWLTAEQGRRLLAAGRGDSLRCKRDYATLAILLGCGLRRAEVAALRIEDVQQREEHWIIADNGWQGSPHQKRTGS